MSRKSLPILPVLVTATCAVALVATAVAQVPHQYDPDIAALIVGHPDLGVFHDYKPPGELSPELATELENQLAVLGVSSTAGFYDLRGGLWGSLILSRPLIPGPGAGNTLAWAGGAPSDEEALGQEAWRAFTAFLADHRAELGIDPAEVGAPRITVHEGGRLIQMNARRVENGIEVRDSHLTAVVNSGNLVLYGTRNWGTGPVGTVPTISKETAREIASSHVGSIAGAAGVPRLSIVTLEDGGDDVMAIPVGEGYRQRLVWALDYRIAGDPGSWEALIDAEDGTLLLFADRNQYAETESIGGVFPVSNDGESTDGIADGVEQPGWPMPFADLRDESGAVSFTNSGGQASGVGATVTTNLSGPFVRIHDNCGAISETATCTALDLGSGPGTDCAVPVPGESSPGNTHSARTGFYEVNRIKELARRWLPDNEWLPEQLTANMNIVDQCNAFWDGSTINFFRDGGSACRNTGEIAAVFDHEWGHGMDANDAVPSISFPGEAPADIYAITRLNSSCIGRGFFKSGTCSGFGDPCLECTGVRDVDWEKRASGMPHDIDWILRPPESPGVPGTEPPGGCFLAVPTTIPGINSGPCLQSTHCEGSVVSEAIWDLLARDLAEAPFGYDRNTALNLVTRLQYLGGGNVDFWYQCNPSGTGGCNADGGYLNYLAVDDDNGDLQDGTPHMSAIHEAFGRHQMACALNTPIDSGCADGPAEAPSVSAEPVEGGVVLSWNEVPGAQEYWLYRADGLHGCEFGKERISIQAETSFTDTGLQPEREYFYSVEAVGANASCRSVASGCASATPFAASSDAPGLEVGGLPGSLAVHSGDGDEFLDNCEQAIHSFRVENSGGSELTNVQVLSVAPVSHSETEVTTPMPVFLADSLPAGCGLPEATVEGSFEFTAGGLSPGDTLAFELAVIADELVEPVTAVVEVHDTEFDFAFVDSKTFSFEEGFEGWELVSGTYTREAVGADATLTHLASSSFEPNHCDRVQSPELKLTETSTLSLANRFAIEPGSPALGFYDRANVGLVDVASGNRATVNPDGGRLYNTSGPNGVCVTQGEDGWSGAGPGFLASTWSSAALGGTEVAGTRMRLDVTYGTDPLIEGDGFQFDEVTVTEVFLQVADAQPNTCREIGPCGPIDDGGAAVDYEGGWHRRSHGEASGGSYHRRLGNNPHGSTARVAFSGDSIIYHYVESDIGGEADVLIDGILHETLAYGPGDNGKENPTFGHSRTYSGLGPGEHTLEVRHRSGAVYVDGFEVPCGEDGSIDASAADSGSETEVHDSAPGELVVERGVAIGSEDVDLSVVVEGSLLPLTVNLLDAAGDLVASGDALVPGLASSGLDVAGLAEGTYVVQVLNDGGEDLEISVARTVAR